MNIPSFSYGAAQVDLDNDGDLDFVVNNIDEPAFLFRNRLAERESGDNHYLRIRLEGAGENTMGLGAFVEIEYGDGLRQYHEHTTYRGYVSSVESIVHFGLGDSTVVDKLTVTWPDSSIQVLTDVRPNQLLTLRQADADRRNEMQHDSDAATAGERRPLLSNSTEAFGVEYVHEEWDYNDFNVQPLLPHKLSQYGPGLAVGDVNGDGREDIYISGSYNHKGTFLIQTRDGSFTEEDLLVGNNPENREEELGVLLFDADGDGDDDLYIVSGSYEHTAGDDAYQDRLFVNEEGRFRLDENALPPFLTSGSAVRAADYDRDGDLDLFVGGRVKPHRYPEPVDSYILENVTEDENRIRFEIVNEEIAPVLNEIGMVTDALWTDFNGDGWIDLLLAGEWMSLRFLKNESGRFVDATDATGISGYKGWWTGICGGDFDNDGDTDYVAGNYGTNTYFQASDRYPVKIYANDFDENGIFDAIPSVYLKTPDGDREEVPFHGRRDLSKQIPSIEKEYETFEAFASVTMDDLLSRYETDGMRTYRANYLKSAYIENRGEGRFSLASLPYEAQWAPVYGCAVEDLNGDGNPDLMMVGNDYGMELSVHRADALNGLLLTGDGTGSFDVMGFEESGFFVPGDGKALVTFVNSRNELVAAASQNRGPLKLFKKEEMPAPIAVRPGDAFSLVYFSDGRVQKKELYYGSGYLSQSERYLIPPAGYAKIEITDFQGNTRTGTPEFAREISQ
ncbi:MAG: FG-GAP-like repeat-containing protein [Balneolaceae bacterium]|nr:FG-GAP-like repeat-containing protein [Balneolaceae bacterium]